MPPLNDTGTEPIGPFASHAGTPTRVEAAFSQVRQDIINGALKPGEKLRIEHLKSRYGVGAGTLREALSLLVSNSLVTVTAQRGFQVAPISLEDFRDITQTRALLENQAVREALARGDDEWEANLVAAYHRLSKVETQALTLSGDMADQWEARNADFHEALAAACQSRWVRRFRSILYMHLERYRRLSLRTVGVSRDVHEEHQRIFEAAMKRDADKTSALITHHIEKTYEVVSKMVEGLEADLSK